MLIIITFFNILCFLHFLFWYFTSPDFSPNFQKLALKIESKKYQNEKKIKQKMFKMLLFLIYEGYKKIFTHFLPIFDHFYPFSPKIFALEQNSPILHFRDPLHLVPPGK